jgi:DNA polymerase/3'-5' exonuclease PolX
LVSDKVFGGVVTPKQEQLLKKRTKFACQRVPGSLAAMQGKNDALVAAFGKMQQHYEKLGDEWRQRSYRTAMNVLRSVPFQIASVEDTRRPELRHLGKKTRDKIVEFIESGSIGRLLSLNLDHKTQVLEELQDIWGVGLTTARKWQGFGIRTVHDVRHRLPELGLNSDQLIGLRYFEEFRQRMPRQEASEIIAVVRTVVHDLFGARLRMEACGSYRRGAETCGDVDVLLTPSRQQEGNEEEGRDIGSAREILSRVITGLGNFLTDHLKASKYTRPEERSRRSATYFGVCQLAPHRLHRRLDIKVYPATEWPFALLSFTGSGPFNRSMRLYARRAGFSLSDHDIRPANHARGQGRGAKFGRVSQ